MDWKLVKSYNRPKNTLSGDSKPILNRSNALSPPYTKNGSNFKTIISFEAKRYPFNNLPHQKGLHYKTTIHLDVTREQSIKNLPYICHRNFISARRITRSYFNPASSQKSAEYNLIYEYVPYSIKSIGLGHAHPRLFKIVAKADFRGILTDMTSFLMRRGIYTCIKMCNIGVSQQGQIKIYVSPQIICGGSLTADNTTIFESNQKLINWWETTFNLSQISCEKKGIQEKKSMNLRINQAEQLAMEGIKKRLTEDRECTNGKSEQQYHSIEKEQQYHSIEKERKTNPLFTTLQSSTASFKSEMMKIGSTQKEKVRIINQELMAIRDRLGKKRISLKKSEQWLKKDQGIKQQQKADIFDSQKLERRRVNLYGSDLEGKNYRFTVQQNINSINIYNPSEVNEQSKRKPVIKNLSQYPVLSYSILPKQDTADQLLTSQGYNLVLEKSGSFFDNPFDIENQESFDTYDLEMKSPEIPDTAQLPQYRLTAASLCRDISQVNVKCHKEKECPRRLGNQNQVETNRFSTSSAGPLQFKNFINNHIKPKFLAKKSNIYEDSLEYESQNSTPSKMELDHICRSIGSRSNSKKSRQLQTFFNTKWKDRQTKKCDLMNSGLKDVYHSSKDRLAVKDKMKQVIERARNAITIVKKVKAARSLDVRQIDDLTCGYQ